MTAKKQEAQEARRQVIKTITGMLQTLPFTFEFKVVKKPKGIKVIYEVTQEQLNKMLCNAAADRKTKKEQETNEKGIYDIPVGKDSC